MALYKRGEAMGGDGGSSIRVNELDGLANPMAYVSSGGNDGNGSGDNGGKGVAPLAIAAALYVLYRLHQQGWHVCEQRSRRRWRQQPCRCRWRRSRWRKRR
uniref:Uncharacterized protein n=1 Tax=Trieres chinensis TaxID=1514140 RepID=A0A6U1Z2G2_TRICV